jgi:hypothetical protein
MIREKNRSAASKAAGAAAAGLLLSAWADPAVAAAARRAAWDGPSPVLFSSDLEDQETSCWSSRPKAGCLGWSGIRDACFNLCVGEKSRTGDKALKIAFAANEDYGGAFRAVSGRHLFTRFYDYYETGFDFAAGMKIHRLSAFNAAAQKNDFDIILQLKSDEPNYNNCGLTEAKYLALSFNGGPVDWGSVEARFTPVRGRWYLVETEVDLNTPGQSDGQVRVWIDGKLLMEKKAMNLTGTVATPINSVLFGGWYSNAAAGKNPCPNPINPSVRYIDDPAVSQAYIGPVPTVSAGTAPGARQVTLILPWGGTLQAEYGPTPAYGSTSKEVVSATGQFTVPLVGVDTSARWHYRLKGTLADGSPWMSPDHILGPPAQAKPAPVPGPAKPRRPGNLPGNRYDPIPD